MEVGQWARDIYNNIGIATKVTEDAIYFNDEEYPCVFKNVFDEIITKVADTPLELIDIDTDLICGFKEDKPLSIDVKHNDCFQCGDRYVEFKDVTKILTPNYEGGYDLQYKI